MAFQVQDIVNRQSDLWRALFAMPKVELHRHLEGSIRLETLAEVGYEHGVPMPSYDPEALRPYVQMTAQDPATHEAFLSKFAVLRQFFCSPEVIQRVVHEAIEDAAADTVRYMELRFTPNALAKAKGFSLEEVITWVCEATQEASKANRIKVNLIVSMNRHESLEIGRATLEAALKFREGGVVALDLAGKEPGFPARPFQCALSGGAPGRARDHPARGRVGGRRQRARCHPEHARGPRGPWCARRGGLQHDAGGAGGAGCF
ncbi:MAG: hypothetical protein HC915_18560 [Anaerolineae bacterium]|nr:hypothetical protein [Anaerolineae bacterium]